jgi:bacterioferritin-associated ferredoxin
MNAIELFRSREGPMYVCLCYSVTDTQVRDAVAAGAKDIGELGRRTGAGTDCGQCRERLSELLADHGRMNVNATPEQGRA